MLTTWVTSQGSSVTAVTRPLTWRLMDRGSDSPRASKFFFFLNRPEWFWDFASLLLGNKGPFSLDNRPDSNADHSPLLCVELNLEFPTYIHGMGTTLLLYQISNWTPRFNYVSNDKLNKPVKLIISSKPQKNITRFLDLLTICVLWLSFDVIHNKWMC